MSEPMQSTPQKEGGLKQPPQTSPAPDPGSGMVGGGETRKDRGTSHEDGGRIGEGGEGSGV